MPRPKKLSRGDKVCGWIECLKITIGEDAGKNFKLRPWQRRFIKDVYDPVHPKGNRVVQRLARGTGRKPIVIDHGARDQHDLARVDLALCVERSVHELYIEAPVQVADDVRVPVPRPELPQKVVLELGLVEQRSATATICSHAAAPPATGRQTARALA